MRNTCTVEGCEQPVVGRGLCRKHYQRWYTRGSVEDRPRERKRCSVDGCDEFVVGRGLCRRHYGRARADEAGRSTINPGRGPIEGRTCAHCGGPIDPMARSNRRYCSEQCSGRAQQKRFREANREKVAEWARWAQRKRKYGISADEYAEMFAKQGGVCASCGDSPVGQGRYADFDIDHDHATGRVRGLLCRDCNQGIARFHDDPERLEAAARYLRG